MGAEPSISPLTLVVCCAVIAGALALAPGRGPFPVAVGRGADIVALEGDAMNRDLPSTVADADLDPDGVTDEVQVLGRMISRTDTPAGDDVAASCTEDCGEVKPPTAVPTGTTPATPADRTSGEDRPDPSGNGATVDPATGGSGDGITTADGSAAGTGVEDGSDVDSCRSPRAVAARNGGPGDVAPPSPCSHGRSDEPCRDGCDDRSRGAKKA